MRERRASSTASSSALRRHLNHVEGERMREEREVEGKEEEKERGRDVYRTGIGARQEDS